MVYFETERLRFRDWSKEDLPQLRKMNKDPQVMRYFPSTLEDAETDAFFERIQKNSASQGMYSTRWS